MLTSDMVELWSQDFIPSMTQEEYDAQPTKDKIFTFNDLDIEASPIQSIAFYFIYIDSERLDIFLLKRYTT